MLVAHDANIVLDNGFTTGKLKSSTGAFMAGCVLILVINMLQHIYCEHVCTSSRAASL